MARPGRTVWWSTTVGFLVLSYKIVPNLGTKTLRLVLDRLSDDWQARYGHPVLGVETFVDPERFCGT